jgi:hypothetical protein
MLLERSLIYTLKKRLQNEKFKVKANRKSCTFSKYPVTASQVISVLQR